MFEGVLTTKEVISLLHMVQVPAIGPKICLQHKDKCHIVALRLQFKWDELIREGN